MGYKTNNIPIRIDEVLSNANREYKAAHILGEKGIISRDLESYLKNLVKMRSCCDIAKLFAEVGDKSSMDLRLWEASNCLREICYWYEAPPWAELAELATNQYHKSYKECEKLLGVTV